MTRSCLLALILVVGGAWLPPTGAIGSLRAPHVLTPHVPVPLAARSAESRWLERPQIVAALRLHGTTKGHVSLDGRSLVYFVGHERLEGDNYWCQRLYISKPGGLAPARLGVAGSCAFVRAEAEHSLRMHLGWAPQGHLLLARLVPARADRLRIHAMFPSNRRTSIVRLDGYPLVAPGSRLVLLDAGRGGISRMDIITDGKLIGTVPGI